jgi:hypothetical protein
LAGGLAANGIRRASVSLSRVRALVDLLTAAKRGDMTAARLVLERISPVRRGRPVHLDLPAVRTASDVAEAMSVLTRAIASGELTPDEAATVAAVFELRRKALETEEFEQRLRALEEKGQGK